MKPVLLIVDDDEAALFGFSQFLNKAGYEVAPAGTLQEAERKLFSMKVDAVLLDMKLPDGHGTDFIP